jgi:hypothetical protein
MVPQDVSSAAGPYPQVRNVIGHGRRARVCRTSYPCNQSALAIRDTSSCHSERNGLSFAQVASAQFFARVCGKVSCSSGSVELRGYGNSEENMASLKNVRIKNFKGVDDVRIEIEGGKAPGRFVTLIGLNESGKTSIIEAIALSVLQDDDAAELAKAASTGIDLDNVVPKHHSAGFTGKTEISVTVGFSDEPGFEEAIKQVLSAGGYVLADDISKVISIQKWYSYEDSNYKSAGTIWNFLPKVRKPTGQKIYDLHEHNKSLWSKCLDAIRGFLPRSIYFPTFLVQFPQRIYLEGDYGKVDGYYRKVVADALNGLSKPLSIEAHILKRVNKHRVDSESFSSNLRSSNEGRQIDATIQELTADINRVVFGAWGEIFKKPVKNRQLIIEWHIDENQGNHIYLEFYILAGDHRFYLSERSSGFRWFFSFLLFTQFQGARAGNRKVVFLFDEPASHLHPKAQERLLTSLEKIASPNHIIIYSTHSHYLINPLWLEQAYIVSNAALDAEGDDTGIDGVGSRVKITADKYKTFVSKFPSKTTYYQPVLDLLDYGSSSLDISDPAIILEGKFDYYPFRYFMQEIGRSGDYKVIPSVGAGALSMLIGILRGWGMRFIVILDDDDAGRKEKAKYRNILMLSSDEVVTLDELDSSLKNKEFEGIMQGDVKDACISAGFSPGPRVTKEQFYSYFQSILADSSKAALLPDTTDLFTRIMAVIDQKVQNQ